MKPSKIHAFILQAVAPVVGLCLITFQVLSENPITTEFILLVGGLIAARYASKADGDK